MYYNVDLPSHFVGSHNTYSMLVSAQGNPPLAGAGSEQVLVLFLYPRKQSVHSDHWDQPPWIAPYILHCFLFVSVDTSAVEFLIFYQHLPPCWWFQLVLIELTYYSRRILYQTPVFLIVLYWCGLSLLFQFVKSVTNLNAYIKILQSIKQPWK
jgi:hypothetical protein